MNFSLPPWPLRFDLLNDSNFDSATSTVSSSDFMSNQNTLSKRGPRSKNGKTTVVSQGYEMLRRLGTNKPIGCRTCRVRRLKCDERHPVCQRCEKAQIKCDWFPPGQSQSLRGRQTPTPDQTSGPPYSYSRKLAPTARDSVQINQRDGDQPIHDSPSFNPEGVTSPILSRDQISLSNSLGLSAEDQQCFLYVPDSIMVLRVGKPWKWNHISYVYTNISGKYPGLMRIFIAGAAREISSMVILASQQDNSNLGIPPKAERLKDSAIRHYHLALKDLSTLLHHVSHSDASDDDVDALFAMWFLILHFGLYDIEVIGASLVHLNGVRSFLKSYLQTAKDSRERRLPPASRIFLLNIS